MTHAPPIDTEAMHSPTRSPDALVYKFIELRERATSPRSSGRLVWAPAMRCAAPGCTSRNYARGQGGYLRCSTCSAKWGEERAMLPAARSRSHGIEGPLAELADLVLLISKPDLWQRRAWYVYLAGDYGHDGLPLRGESKGDYQGVARHCRWRWAAQGWTPNASAVVQLVREARRTVERESQWRAG